METKGGSRKWGESQYAFQKSQPKAYTTRQLRIPKHAHDFSVGEAVKDGDSDDNF